MSKKEKFLSELKTWEGTPFMQEGGCKRVGSNCSHFVLVEIFNSLGITTPELERCVGVKHLKLLREDPAVLISGLDSFCKRVPLNQMQAGDIATLLLHTTPVQVVVYCGSGQFIYSTKNTGVVLKKLPANMEKRISGVFRPRVFEEEGT